MNHPIAHRAQPADAETVRRAASIGALALVACGLAIALYQYPPPSASLLVAGGVGATAVLALAIGRLEAAVALGFLLLGVVKVEPAPPDLVFACVVAVAAVTGRFDISRVPKVALFSVSAFLGLSVLSMIEVIDPVRASFFVTITLYLAIFSLWFASYLDSQSKARGIVLAYLIAASLSAFLGIAALYVGFPGSSNFLYDPTRVEALFKDPNVFGPFLIPIALIVLEEMLNPRLLRLRLPAKAALFTLLSLGVVFSFSRAAWLNLTVGIAVVLVATAMRRGGSRRALGLLLILAVGATVAMFFIAKTGTEHFITERASVQTYDTERFGAQEEGLVLATQHPFGIGPGQFDVYSPVAAHSTYVRALTETGLLGLCSLLVMIVGTAVLALRNVVLGRDTYGIGSAALLGAWCGLLANSFFVDTLHWRHLWIVAALIWAGAMRRRPARAETAATPANARTPYLPSGSRP